MFSTNMLKPNRVSDLRRNGQELPNRLGEPNEKAINPGDVTMNAFFK